MTETQTYTVLCLEDLVDQDTIQTIQTIQTQTTIIRDVPAYGEHKADCQVELRGSLWPHVMHVTARTCAGQHRDTRVGASHFLLQTTKVTGGIIEGIRRKINYLSLVIATTRTAICLILEKRMLEVVTLYLITPVMSSSCHLWDHAVLHPHPRHLAS